MTMGIALPICSAILGSDHGSYENLKNSLYMLFHNPLILGMNLIYFSTIPLFNWVSFVYARFSTAAARTLVDACRTVVVWVVLVLVYYTISKTYGEPMTWWSFMEAFGFAAMVLGTTIHNNIGGAGEKLTNCCLKKPSETVNDKPLMSDFENTQ
jgi:hypothetical protein